jgi:hypothetical protein
VDHQPDRPRAAATQLPNAPPLAQVKIIRGMAGYGANLSNKERQQLKDDVFEIVPEGVEGVVPYRYVATTPLCCLFPYFLILIVSFILFCFLYLCPVLFSLLVA